MRFVVSQLCSYVNMVDGYGGEAEPKLGGDTVLKYGTAGHFPPGSIASAASNRDTRKWLLVSRVLIICWVLFSLLSFASCLDFGACHTDTFTAHYGSYIKDVQNGHTGGSIKADRPLTCDTLNAS